MKQHLTTRGTRVSWVGLLNLMTVYFIWGSTYLAIRIAVRDGLGFPPFFLAASRVILAGSLLLLFAVLQRQRIRLNRTELIVLAISGSLLWVGGNGLVSWSEQKVSSGLAALIVGATPIFVALMESAIDRKIPSLLLVGSLLVGFGGIVILTFPVIRSGIRADVLSVIGLLAASFSWGAGSLLQSRNPVRISPFVSSGYQHLFGAFGLIILSLITRENFQSPPLDAWLAWGYLVVFGSIIAFTSFINVLQILPTNIVMTYSYVNPVIAVFLGWVILGERITVWTIAGTLLVLLGVWGVFRTRYKKSA
ncbi:MAG: EamA family transporter [Anaerolineae bacterium]|nr:EamA family transporter [Anaerolineae bacterium]